MFVDFNVNNYSVVMEYVYVIPSNNIHKGKSVRKKWYRIEYESSGQQ